MVMSFRVRSSELSRRTPTVTALMSAMTHTTTMRLHHSKGHYYHASVVDDAVDGCCCHVIVAEDLAPLGKREVGGDDQAALFIGISNGLEQQPCPVSVDGDVAEFIDDEQLVFTKRCKLFVEPACVFRVA